MPDEDAAAAVPVPVPVEGAEEVAEEVAEDLGTVAEMISQDSIVREEQHKQVMEVLAQCQTRLSELSTLTAQKTESPVLVQLETQVSEMQAELVRLTAYLEASIQKDHSKRTAHQTSDTTKPEGSTLVDGQGKSQSEDQHQPQIPATSVPSEQALPERKRRFNKL
jgi:hypothetical protein